MKRNYLWYKKSDDLRFPDTVHQILVFGTLSDISSLKSKIGVSNIREIFLDKPKNLYTRADFNFIKNYILNIDRKIDEASYLKTSARDIKPRTTTTS